MNSKITILAIYLFLSLFINSKLFSQDFQSKGRDFWLTFMPNYHNNYNSPDTQFLDSLYIYIAADDTCSGKITAYTRQGIPLNVNFKINDINQVYTFKVPAYDYELWGYNHSGDLTQGRNQSEMVSKLAFNVTATADVTVYAHSQAVTTSDAFIVFPTTVLGNKYFVMSFNSDGALASQGIATSSTPSQFAIISVEDNNEITIKPKEPTKYNFTYTQKIKMNKGDVYLVQANISRDSLFTDLTGTEIEGTKKFAVFAGHQRATIPIEAKYDTPSRDFLAEQMIPVINWGKNAFIIPFATDPTASPKWKDVYRIIAAYDLTGVKIGNDSVTLNSGQFYQGYIEEPLVVSANNKIMVAQFKKTSADGSHLQAESDPFMVIVPPKEQFLKKCRVINAQAYEKSGLTSKKVYNTQYISIVAPTKALNTLKIDNTIVNSNLFLAIPSSDYSYASIKVNDGVHLIECNEPFEVYIYGYGVANSYGYLGGMSFVPIVYDVPKYDLSIKCDSLMGIVSVEKDKDIKLTNVWFTNPNNITAAANAIDSSSTKINGKLIDKRNDGSIEIYAKDSKGRTETKKIEIGGFTIAFVNNGNLEYNVNISSQVEINTSYNFILPIRNYGKFTQKVSSLKRKNNDQKLIIGYIVNKDILPLGAKDDTLTITFKTDVNENYEDEISLFDNCGNSITIKVNFSTSKCGRSSFEYSNFINESKIYKVGYTYKTDNLMRLTSFNQNVVGSFWKVDKVPVGKNFYSDFKFIFRNGNNNNCNDNSLPGADGIAFVIQNNSLNSIGTRGGGIGYEGISNAIAIEYDTFNNDSTQIENYLDPNGNHIAIMKNNKNPLSPKHLKETTIGINTNILQIEQNKVYFSRIEYKFDDKQLNVFLDTNGTFDKPSLSINNFDIKKELSLDNDMFAFIGFTSATGCASEIHDILSWSFCGATITDIKENIVKNNDNTFQINYFNNKLEIKSLVYFDKIRLFDATGRLVYENRFDKTNNLDLYIDYLINSVYFIEINADNNLFRSIFIKN